MTKTATYQLTLVLFSTLTLGGCGKDPFAGDSPGTDGALLGTGGTTSDAPSGTPTIDYKISVWRCRSSCPSTGAVNRDRAPDPQRVDRAGVSACNEPEAQARSAR